MKGALGVDAQFWRLRLKTCRSLSDLERLLDEARRQADAAGGRYAEVLRLVALEAPVFDARLFFERALYGPRDGGQVGRLKKNPVVTEADLGDLARVAARASTGDDARRRRSGAEVLRQLGEGGLSLGRDRANELARRLNRHRAMTPTERNRLALVLLGEQRLEDETIALLAPDAGARAVAGLAGAGELTWTVLAGRGLDASDLLALAGDRRARTHSALKHRLFEARSRVMGVRSELVRDADGRALPLLLDEIERMETPMLAESVRRARPEVLAPLLDGELKRLLLHPQRTVRLAVIDTLGRAPEAGPGKKRPEAARA